MVGTDSLRGLRAATTAAKCKTVLVGDAHQPAPVRARGGSPNFATICRGRNAYRRCGGCAIPPSAPRR
jgi:hypothetical protein